MLKWQQLGLEMFLKHILSDKVPRDASFMHSMHSKGPLMLFTVYYYQEPEICQSKDLTLKLFHY